MGMRQETHPFLVAYTHKDDAQGQTNRKRAYQQVIEATLKYIKENNL